MKKIIFIALMFSAFFSAAVAQDKGSYITVGGNLGWTKFCYDLDDGDSKGRLGYGGSIGYQYFFNRHWGVSVEAEFSAFNTRSKYNDKLFTFANQIDDEGDIYDLDVRLKGWKENQTTYFIDVPLMLRYQHKFGNKQAFGLYFGVGGKVQFPIKSTYKRKDGDALLSAYYPATNLRILDEYPLPLHGYGSNGNLGWDGDNELNIGVAVTGDFGFLIALSRRVDLTIGVSADYGLMDIKDKEVGLIYPTGNQQQVDYIAQNIAYEGVLNSREIDKINPLALKGEIGLRIKIGKLTEREEQPKKEDEILDLLRGIAAKKDTIIVNPIIEVNIPATAVAQEDITEEEIAILMEPVYFDLNKSNLRPDAVQTLDSKIEMLKKYRYVDLTILGHTCDLGGSKYNYDLAMKRAQAVKSYLIRKGIKSSRLSIISEGKDHPDNPNDTEAHRQLNRKVEFIVGE